MENCAFKCMQEIKFVLFHALYCCAEKITLTEKYPDLYSASAGAFVLSLLRKFQQASSSLSICRELFLEVRKLRIEFRKERW